MTTILGNEPCFVKVIIPATSEALSDDDAMDEPEAAE